MSESTIQKALKVKRAVAEYFEANPSVRELPAKDLMPYFIQKGIFEKDNKDGNPIRKLLRKLNDEKQLQLIPQARGELKNVKYNWFFDNIYAGDVEEVSAKQPTNPKKQSGKRSNSDEAYVIDLVDEVLGLTASRQHKFDFLRGDLGKYSKRHLPVDAYYESINLVVEYREKQHTETVRFWNKTTTISGVSRDEQRRIYDQRRREVLPVHGITLIEFDYSEFKHRRSKELTRDATFDRLVIDRKLKNLGVLLPGR